jgi:uncharacterized protein YgbK (DUF1537 family)
VTADDTTGALESAARAADEGWATTVVAFGLTPHDSGAGCTVIDLRSLHLGAAEAARRMTSALQASPSVRAHKIDSTHRGNWPEEIAAVVGAGRRALMVPAYPAAGRRCVGGVVFEHDVPLDRTAHIDDPRSRVRTARPASLLAGAAELGSIDMVDRWLAEGGRVAVADAVDDDQLLDVVTRAIEHDDVLIVGTAAVVGAVARRVAALTPPVPLPSIAAPVLVVCGSLHPSSRAQVDALLAAGAVRVDASAPAAGSFDRPVLVVSSPIDRGDDSVAVALDLARRAHSLIRSAGPRTIVLVGGDTAEAVIGARSVSVEGSLDVGVAIGIVEVDGQRITVVAKPGAFGGPTTLVDLMSDVLPRVPG